MSKPSAIRATSSAIVAAGNSISALFNTTTAGISMLDNAVTKASDEQQARHLAESLTFEERLARQISREVSELERKSDAYCKRYPDQRSTYEATYSSFREKLNSLKNKPQTDEDEY